MVAIKPIVPAGASDVVSGHAVKRVLAAAPPGARARLDRCDNRIFEDVIPAKAGMTLERRQIGSNRESAN
jgi:hypothetical protein